MRFHHKPHKRHKLHIETKHSKLHGPDWALSEQMLDRAIDAIHKRIIIDHRHHVPYLAGYSNDGRTIYIDRDLPASFKNRDGERVPTFRYLVLHESVEKALIDRLNLHYQHAHQIALRVEKSAVVADGVSWKEYDDFMQEWIKEAGHETCTDLPGDLDITPYKDEHDDEMLALMKSQMAATRAARKKRREAGAIIAVPKKERKVRQSGATP
jgi:hypothetical protein